MPTADLYNTLFTAMETVETAAAAGPTLTWTSYKASPPSGGATITLTNSDFNGGTLRITSGNCVFKLSEDIIIESGTAPDFFPTESVEYAFPPYQLGWFAGITVETTEAIVINLNGYRIQQSELFALQQRFYAIIEIGDQPFLSTQGPSSFGTLVPGGNVTIKNGILGRSSHHGIHSPGSATNVLIENLQIQDFEVAGIHLNGAINTVIRNCNIGPIRLDVPVLGTYSQCRFIRSFVTAIDLSLTLPFITGAITGTEILADLDYVMTTAYNNISASKLIDYAEPKCSFMANTKWFGEKSFSSGGAYGLVLNRSGVAVNGFLMTHPIDVGNSNILVDGVCVSNINSATVEIVGVSNPNSMGGESYGGGGAFQAGPVGDIFRIDELTDSSGVYASTALSNAQLFVALRGVAGTIGTTNIPTDTSSGIMGWALSGNKNFGVTNISTVLTTPATNNLYRIYDGDAMAHVCKGNIGIFIQGADDIEVSNSNVMGVSQTSVSSLGALVDYPSPTYKSHPAQSLPYYGGATSRGIAIASSKTILLKNTKIDLINSKTANTIGIDYIGVNTFISTDNITVGTLMCPVKDGGGANQKAIGCPMRIRSTTAVTSVTSTGTCPALIVDSS